MITCSSVRKGQTVVTKWQFFIIQVDENYKKIYAEYTVICRFYYYGQEEYSWWRKYEIESRTQK